MKGNKVFQSSYDYSTRQGVHPISWEDFHGICKALVVAVSPFQPEIILPIGRGGYYPGTLLSHMLQIEIYPVRISRRINDVVKHKTPQWIIDPPAEVAGRRALVVDEICSSGETIIMVKEKAAAMGASAVKSAVLYAHTWSISVPDYIGLITDALVLNPWDREIFRDEKFHFHPEYVEALAHQGVEAGPQMLIHASNIRLDKGLSFGFTRNSPG
jgi:hypoxanthine phosphoribosyltransferase